MSDPSTLGIVVSCEHAGNRVPPAYRELFAGAEEVLASHRGFDIGAEPIARALAAALGVKPLVHGVTRLLVDPNRSLGHPRSFSDHTRGLPASEREAIVDRHYRPHRRRVEEAVLRAIEMRGGCLHLGIHTFTPVLDGVEREAEIGILYDPDRELERRIAARWREEILRAGPGWRVRRNYPYRGTGDGLTTSLRRIYPDAVYAGIELEASQAILGRSSRRETAERLVASVGWLARAGRGDADRF